MMQMMLDQQAQMLTHIGLTSQIFSILNERVVRLKQGKGDCPVNFKLTLGTYQSNKFKLTSQLKLHIFLRFKLDMEE